MVLVEIEAERAESAVHAIQAVHIAFAFVRIGVQLALHEEALFKQRLQPWRPPVVLLFLRTLKQSKNEKTESKNQNPQRKFEQNFISIQDCEKKV